MPSPADPHDPHNDLDRQDNLTLMALGEAVDADFAQHQQSCPSCRAELAALSATVHLARTSSRDIVGARPPARLWAAIEAATTGATDVPVEPVEPIAPVQPLRRSIPWRLGLIAAAIALAVGIGGFVMGRDTTSTRQSVAARAVLVPQRGGPTAVTGSAQVIQNVNGYTVSVTTRSLPIRTGYYAVWVYDPTINHMINIGALNADGTGLFSLPPGVEIHDYNIIDVSAQNFDGNPAHQQSVLQGPLTK